MAVYITHIQLAERPGARELAQVASDEHQAALVPDDLLDAALRGASTAQWTAEDVAHADRALERINDAVREAGALIDGYLSARYRLPLAGVPRILGVWARAITRYLLHKSRVSLESNDPIVRDYRDALKLLQLVAEGKFSLGEDDPIGNTSATDVRFSSDAPVFSRRQLRVFR